MKKRIYLNFLGLMLLSVLLISTFVCAIVFNVIINQEMAAIRDRAQLVSDLLDNGLGGGQFIVASFADYFNHNPGAARLTVIASDGTVLIDNKASAEAMGNHSDREEFRQAILTGNGEATRYSYTTGLSTYYYAVLLGDGSVLRVSKAMYNITGIFSAILPAIAAVSVLVLLIANMVSRRLTGNILQPLNEIDFDGDNTIVYDELLPYVKKIEQQKREIDTQIVTLKNRTDTIEAITGNMKEGLLLIDKAGMVLIANKSASEIFHEYSITQKNILHICRGIEFQQGVKQCLSGVGNELEFERGEKIYSVYFSPVHSGEKISGGAILFLDCTEKLESERQRREFSANVSHELKTPLTSICALAEIIENDIAKEEDIKGFAGKITIQARRLICVIEDIIRLSEFDEGKVGRDYSEFDLYELVESVIEALREKMAEKNIAIRIDGIRPNLSANRQMIDELIYNLIDNAIKYNKENGSIAVTLECESGFCKIIVADTGIGIPMVHKNRIFERFYRVDRSRSKKTGGTGLGLSIVRHIAEHHRGRVELESIPGESTTVVCWLAE